jgi:hypothetical protein
MAFDPVPWAVGGGALVDVDMARMQTYFMFQGYEGVFSSADLEVKALATPGGSVRISPGGAVIIGRGPGQLYESYMGRNKADVVVSISPNNGASTRSDLVFLRVEDPYIAGSEFNIPGDPAVGPYIFPRVLQSVPSTLRTVRALGNNWSAIPLARIDIPANTATITQGMIVPLRTKVGPPPPPAPPPTAPPPTQNDDTDPQSEEQNVFLLNGGPSSGSQDLTSAQVGTWRNWPSGAEFTVPIPPWATTMDAILTLHNTFCDNDVWGEVRIEVGSGELYSPARVYDLNPSGWERFEVVAGGGKVAIPCSIRGKNKRFRINARSLSASGDHTGTLKFDRGSLAELRIGFKEQT